MALFDQKNFNGEVFGAYVDRVPNLNRNELLKSGAIVEKPQYATMLPDQTGGNYITIPIKARTVPLITMTAPPTSKRIPVTLTLTAESL